MLGRLPKTSFRMATPTGLTVTTIIKIEKQGMNRAFYEIFIRELGGNTAQFFYLKIIENPGGRRG